MPTPSPTARLTPTGVTWIVVPFNNSFAPGPKTFDFYINQVTFTRSGPQAADLSDGYYFGNQTLVVAEGQRRSPRRTRSPSSRTRSSAPRSGRPASTRSRTSSSRRTRRRSTTPTTLRSRPSRRSRSTASSSTCRPPTTSPCPDRRTRRSSASSRRRRQPEHFSLRPRKGSALTACVEQPPSAADRRPARWTSSRQVAAVPGRPSPSSSRRRAGPLRRSAARGRSVPPGGVPAGVAAPRPGRAAALVIARTIVVVSTVIVFGGIAGSSSTRPGWPDVRESFLNARHLLSRRLPADPRRLPGSTSGCSSSPRCWSWSSAW